MSRHEFCLSDYVTKRDFNQFVKMSENKFYIPPLLSDVLISDHFSWKFHKAYYTLIFKKYPVLDKDNIRDIINLYYYADQLEIALGNKCSEIHSKVGAVEHIYDIQNVTGDYNTKYHKYKNYSHSPDDDTPIDMSQSTLALFSSEGLLRKLN